MTAQAAGTAAALWTRLQPSFDDTPRTAHIETAAGQAHWPGGGFGHAIADIKTIVVHCTSGWPNRNKWDEFVSRYTDPAADKRGIGPHYFIPYDGTVFRLLSENKVCWHASHVNDRAIGVETGNLTEVAHPTLAGGAWPHHWAALSHDAEDLPGEKLYARSVNNEILVAHYTSASAVHRPDAHVTAASMMLFSEAQYRGWALLARWLAEVWKVPRNFPLRPHIMRQDLWQAARWLNYREIVDADPVRDLYIRTQMLPAPYHCDDPTFESDDAATGLPHVYAQGVHTTPATATHPAKQTNLHWTHLFNAYRGFHGHGFSGANSGDDHNCPGPWFDWQRFARQVWDWWWYPFDLDQAAPDAPVTSGAARRDYGLADARLREHYFDVEPAPYAKVTTAGFYPIGDETVAPHFLPGPPLGPIGNMVRMWRQYWGFWHGGMHFELDAGSPVYALAAGQIVAARLGPTSGDADRTSADSPLPGASFVLLRHEVFWQRGDGDRFDYDTEPTRVYSLYMHLGIPDALDVDHVVDDNPTWLNSVIAMKKEVDLGQAFNAAHPNPAAQWVPHATRWSRRQPVLDALVDGLRAGNIVRFPEGEDAIQVALGDFLGIAGHLDTQKSGVHLEIFSNDQITDPWFEASDQSGSASRPFHDEANLDDVTAFLNAHVTAPQRGMLPAEVYRLWPAEQKASSFHNIALRSKSEWALQASDFPDGGWTVASDLMWWDAVVPDMNAALTDAAAQLPADAIVWHYHPLGFLSWLNALTWRSEWPKYRVTDDTGAAVDAPDQPPPRS